MRLRTVFGTTSGYWSQRAANVAVRHRYACDMAATSTIDTIVSLCKRRGFVFPCGEIYGGTRSAWDYGPLGVELKDNIKRQWWKSMVQQRDDVVGLDSSDNLQEAVAEKKGIVDPDTVDLSTVACPNCGTRGSWTEPRAFSGLLKTYLGVIQDDSGLHLSLIHI